MLQFKKINVNDNGLVSSLLINGQEIQTDILLSGADYHHTEQLLPSKYRQYSDKYWKKKKICTILHIVLCWF